MALSRVEVEVPFGREEAIEESVVRLGGKVLSIKTEPIGPATGINATRLLRHIRLSGVDTAEVKGLSNYREIFTFLREFPVAQQSALLESFLGANMRDSRTGVRLGRFLTLINNMNWLKPQEGPNPEEMQQLSDQYYQQMNLPSLPVSIVRENWNELGKRIVDGFTEGSDVTFTAKRDAYFSKFDNQARGGLGNHRDYREAFQAQIMANSILGDISMGDWKGRIPELRYYGGAGFSYEDFGKMGAVEAIQTDARLTAVSLALERHLPKFGFTKGVLAEGLFNSVYDNGFIFVGPVQGRSVIFIPRIKN